MTDFTKFSKAVRQRFDALSKHELFVVSAEKDAVWGMYLESFPEGSNPIYRERTEHDCSCCRHFVRNIGNVVAIIDGQIESVWDVDGLGHPYDEVAATMASYVRSFPVAGLFRADQRNYGAEQTLEPVANGFPKRWNHFHAPIADRHYTKDVDAVLGTYATTASVFARGLTELLPSAFTAVVELIEANALYRGAEHLPAVKAFQKLQDEYFAIKGNTARNMAACRQLFVWAHAADPATRFRNTAIGTLVQDLSEGMELEAAVRSFETKVAPTNYKRTTALITPAMVKQAMTTINELGLESALERRFAKLSDVSVNNVLWVDGTVRSQMKDGIEGLLMEAATAPTAAAKQKPVDIGIEQFMAEVLPLAKTISVLVRNTMQNNFMSLTAPVHADVQPLFKWANNFGWSYNGNITDSIKDKVKRAGGNTEAKLRISLAWFNSDDLDIHIQEPDRNHIYFGNKGGKLDVDMNAGGHNNAIDPVENVSFNKPQNGTYQIHVNQYNKRSTANVGFVIEVENDGAVSQYSYQKAVSGNVEVGTLTVKDGTIVELKFNPDMTGGGITQEKWGIQTERFAKVNTLMFSPNHWDDQSIGNKHWFFVLDGCLNDEPTRGIYNEFLNSELDKHRKVFEVLGEKTKCPVTTEQLSGVGFSSTRGDSVVVQVTGDKLLKTYNITF